MLASIVKKGFKMESKITNQTPEVASVIEERDMLLSKLSDLVNTLECRFSSVLTPPAPAEVEPEVGSGVPMAFKLKEGNASLRRSILWLEQIKDRCEL